MKEQALNILRSLAQWSTLVLSVVFRDQFAGGVVLRGIGGILIALGLTLWVLSRVQLGEAFTSSPSPKGFVTEGIYAKLRHPMYTGGFLLFAGIGAVLQSIIGLALTGLLVLPLLVYSAVEEERRMLDKFGEEYADYKKHTVF
jgi:protein-S-isoprenylcysteine O-methyltransferase Ste14